jgi:hypothetical protein
MVTEDELWRLIDESRRGFDYFRYWLISMGRRVYEDALVDPESLAAAADRPASRTSSSRSSAMWPTRSWTNGESPPGQRASREACRQGSEVGAAM